MLYKIFVENFFSVADGQELVFKVPGNAPDLSCLKTSFSDSHIRLPAVIGFFGPNASGKSTILRAVKAAILFACHSFESENYNFLFQSYRRKEWLEKPTKIAIEFDAKLDNNAPSAIFRYELYIVHVYKDGNFGDKKVTYEALSYKPEKKFRTLFERNDQDFYFGTEFGVFKADDPRTQSIRPNASVISTLAKLNHPLSTHLSQSMSRLQTSFEDKLPIEPWLDLYFKDPSCCDNLNRELQRLDVGIEAMHIEQGPQGLFARFKHMGLDDFIFHGEESMGTQRFVRIFPLLYYVLKAGNIAIIDELDVHLHPQILPEIFRWFSNAERNPHGAQLIFSAQNPALLDDLEKEQVYFTEKPTGKPSHVYGAHEIKDLRRGPSLMKKYLAGELGAVPHIG